MKASFGNPSGQSRFCAHRSILLCLFGGGNSIYAAYHGNMSCFRMDFVNPEVENQSLTDEILYKFYKNPIK